jgi:hypothetical protein
MNNKLKSLLYLSAFMVAAVLYHTEIEAPQDYTHTNTNELAEADIVIHPFTQDIAQDRTQ